MYTLCHIYLSFSVPKSIDRENLHKDHGNQKESFIGEGAFGTCTKMKYKGIEVAVKRYQSHVHKTSAQWEASIVNLFDHPGN